jgi:hypothetical protein
MGFLSRAEDEEEYTGEKWEYKARNLAKVVGPGLEDDFKKFGADGWEFGCRREGLRDFQAPHRLGSTIRPPHQHLGGRQERSVVEKICECPGGGLPQPTVTAPPSP